MVKSSSCLRLITCGSGDATDKQDHQLVSEIKDSNDKRGWSFRKRSARHRVLSNTVITETPSSANKESSEYSSINCQSAEEPNVVEKICTTNFSNEKPQLSSVACSEMSETIVAETEGKVDVNLPESDVIIIQAAIRGYLAQRTLQKSKHVVKLQAAVRGHLVRRHAAGTLRCVQAIVKMQLLVRARHAKQSHSDDNLNHSDSKNDYSKTLDNEHHMAKSNVKHTSVEKLLSNKFARQMLESTPKNKPIHVKCDPSKGDSAWKWLERWMTVSAKDSAENKKPINMSEQSDETKDSTHVSQSETGIPSQVILQLADSKPTVRVSPLPSEDEEKTATYDDNNSNFPANPSTSFIKDNLEEALPKKTTTNDAKEITTEIDSFQNEIMESNASVPQEPQIDEQCEQSTKAFASDQLEIDGKKFSGGSRKLSNPAFIAAQSKFEELSSMANSSKPSSLFSQDVSVDSQADTSSVADTAYISKEFVSSENSALYPSKIGDSEYGTVLSISSTLDSPDISEVETLGSEHDAKDLAEGIVNPENTIDHGVLGKTPRATPTSNLAISDSDQLEYINGSSGNIVDSVMPENSKESSEKNASDLLSEQTENVLQDFKLSLEASPGSHITIPESQGTPSSQVSVKPKENKIKKTGSSSRRRALSVGNKSPANANQDSGSRASVGNKSPANANHDSGSRASVGNKSPANANHDSVSRVSVGTKSPANANHDSGSRGSREQLPKDQLNGKRRNSFGSVKPDHAEQEPRENSSNNSSLPRFMQATESARAKLNANSSPRSSPDVHDHDLKKRHSLPGATGRQGSPRVEQSLPQAQHGTKGSGVNAHSERKWQR